MNTQEKQINPLKATVLFTSVVGCFVFVWTILPTLLHSGYRNDLIEILFIGKEWVFANTKHPALTSWLTEIAGLLTGRAFFAPFFVSQLCTVVTVWSVWQVARSVLEEKHALIAVFATLPIRLLTEESVLFNHNSVLLATYALSVCLVLRAFQTNRLIDWITAGVVIGLGLHNKYSFGLLIPAILLYMILRPAGRKHWSQVGPYLTTALAFLIFLPHLFWLFSNGFPTIAYVSNTSSSRLSKEIWSHVYDPSRFAICQLLYWLPSLIVLLPALGWIWTWKSRTSTSENTPISAKECERFLFYCAIFPILVHLVVCACGVHLRMVYGAPFWCFLPVWLMLCFQVRDQPQLMTKTILFLVGVETVLIAGFLTTFFLGKQPSPVYLPMDTLARECDRIWDNQQFSQPCPYVTGDMILAGHAAYRMSNRPSVHVGTSTWSSHDDVNRLGGIVLWPMEEVLHENEENGKPINVPPWVHERFPRAKVLSSETLVLSHPQTIFTSRFPSFEVGIAIIPPP